MFNVSLTFNAAVFNDWINTRLQEENNKANSDFSHLLDTTSHSNSNPHSNNHTNGPQHSNTNPHSNSSPHDNGSYHSNSGGSHSNSGSPHSNSSSPQHSDHHNLPGGHQNTGGHSNTLGHEDGHLNTSTHNNSGGHSNSGTPHSNSSPHDNGSYHSNASPHSNTTPHNNTGHSNAPHSNVGFDHQNYKPTVPELFELNNSDRVKDVITIGIFSYDRNVKPAGSTDAASTTIKYNLMIRKVKELDGTPAASSWRNLLTNTTANTFELNTKSPLGAGLNDGIYELQVWAQNDPRTQNGVSKQYIGQTKTIEIVISQNLRPELTVKNGDEFINFIFGPEGAIDVTDGYIPYSETLYTEAAADQQAGIFVSVEMRDDDLQNWQKGWVYLADSANNEIAGTRVSVVWDSGEVAHSSGSLVNGYAFISKDKFVNDILGLEGAKLVVEIKDYDDADCTVPTGDTLTQHTISATDLTLLSFNIDVVKPTVTAVNEDYSWQNEDITVSLLYSDDRSGMRITRYKATESEEQPDLESLLDYTGDITLQMDGQYYIHYRAVDRLGNEQIGYFGPYKRDTVAPIITIRPEENGTGVDIYRYVREININPMIEDALGVETLCGVTTTMGEVPALLYVFEMAEGINFTGDGTEGLKHYYVYIRATDEAGNVSEEWSEVFKFNNISPQISAVDIALTDGYAQGLVDFNFVSSDLISGELDEDTLTYRIYQKKVGSSDDYIIAVESIFDPENSEGNREALFIDFYRAAYQHRDKYLFYFEVEDLAGNKTVYPVDINDLFQPIELTVRKEVQALEISSEGPTMTFDDRLVLIYNTPIELSAIATFVDGTSMAEYPDIAWSLSDLTIAELTPIGDSGMATLLASDIGDLTITVRDNLTGIETTKEVEVTKPVVALSSLEDQQLIYGNTLSITVTATLEDSTVYDGYPYLVIMAADPDIVSINGNQITAVGLGTTTITVTDAFDSSKYVAFELLVKKSPQQRLEDIAIPTDTPVPSFELPVLETGQSYTITVIHNPSGDEVIHIETEGGWITLEGLQEGHNYDINFKIIDDDSNILAERTINYTVIDVTPPEITGVYILQGKLYVLATDNYRLHDTPYGFQVLSAGGTTVLSVQADEYGSVILVSDVGGSVTNINFSASNNIAVVPPKRIYIKVIDEYINEAEVDVNVTQYNQVLYGTVPQDIINQIYAANNPPDNSPSPLTPPPAGTVEVPLPQEIIELIQDVLGKDNLTVEAPSTAPNSGQGSLHIKTPRYIDELRSALLKHNYNGMLYYRIDVIEKGLNRLVYTNTLNDIREIIIPGLADSTTYIVRISIVHDGKRLAFREIEQQTADATPPVIEKVVINDGSLQVFARDNMKLHDTAYQYQLQIGNSTVSLNPFGVQALNGLQVASLDISSIIAANWNQQAWTSESRLSGLDTGTRVKVIVRDHAENYTMTDIDVQGDGTLYDTVNGAQPLELRPNQSVELADILQELLQQYNHRNPDNAIDIDRMSLGDFDIRLSDPSIAYFENGRLVTRGNGQLIITFIHRKTGIMYKYSILITDMQSFDRRIIIQTGSETDIGRAFGSSIEKHFKGQEITFVSENEKLGELDSETLIFKANDSEGLAKIIITNGKKELPIYVIIVKDKFPESDIQLIKTQLSYVLKEGETVDIRDISVFYNEGYGEANTDYLIVEADSSNVEINGNLVKAISEGLGNVYVIDLVTQRIEVIDFMIISLLEAQVKASDIKGHWAEEAIETVLSKGILKDLNNDKYSPDEYVTRQQLLQGISELKVYLRDSAIERRNTLPLEISKEDIHYYSIMNALNKLTIFEVEYIFGRRPSLSNVITREETAALLSLELGLKATDNKTDYVDIGRSKFREEILAVNEASIMKGYEESFNPEGSLTRAEMAAIFHRLIKFME